MESASAADYVPNYSSLARQGYDLIIGVGFAQGDAIDIGATEFPDTDFAIVDVDQAGLKHKPKNVLGLLFREQEAGYLAGYLAGLTAKRDNASTIGSVGGFKEPPVDRFIAGYQAGANEAMPGIKTLNAYSSDWDDQAKCKELALIADRARRQDRLPGRRRLRARRARAPRRRSRSGGSASTPTSRTSARTSSRARRSASTSPSS